MYCLSKASLVLRKTPLSRSKLMFRLQSFFVSSFYRKNTVEIDNYIFTIHSGSEFIAKKLILFSGYEKEEISLLYYLVKPGDTVVDIGANIGLYTVYLSKAVGENGRVLAFEPDPDNLLLLNENIRLNHCDNIIVFPLALGASASTQRLYLCDENKGYQSFADLAQSGKSIEIEVKKASDFIDNYYPTIVKIDVEGAEPLVWKGMKYKPPYLLFEFVPAQIRALGNDPLTFLKTLVTEGYSLQRVENSQLISVTPETMTELAEGTGKDYNIIAQK